MTANRKRGKVKTKWLCKDFVIYFNIIITKIENRTVNNNNDNKKRTFGVKVFESFTFNLAM